MTKTKKETKHESFLNENQLEGKLSESNKMEIKSLDEAIASVTHIINPDAVKFFKEAKEEDYPTKKIVTYCQDCHDIVPPAIMEMKKGKSRLVCGNCRSKRIARGTEDSIRTFYNFKDKQFGDKKDDHVIDDTSKKEVKTKNTKKAFSKTKKPRHK